jgi:hypothetical protein
MIKNLTIPISVKAAELRQKRSIGNLWDNFIEVTKLDDVVKEMRILEKDENTDMLNLKGFLKGENFSAIATCLRASEDYVDVN